jgi:3-hydroxyisobutyrate dehydrogenase
MTRHLIAAGHDVTVASRSRGPIEKAVTEGATEGDGPRAVVTASEVTILCVPSSPDVSGIVDDIIGSLDASKIIVDTSTIDPTVERAQHDRVAGTGAGYLDAPLSGGTVGAEKGTLTLMVGGDTSVLERARPALDPFAGLIVHVGGPGVGQVVKLCNQLIYAAQMLAVSEATALAEKSGVDLRLLHEVGTHATADCVALRTRIPVPGVLPDSPATNNWQPGFMTDLMAKDVDLVLAYAARIGAPTFSAGVVRPVLGAASAAGYGREDFSAIGKIVQQLAGLDQ